MAVSEAATEMISPNLWHSPWSEKGTEIVVVSAVDLLSQPWDGLPEVIGKGVLPVRGAMVLAGPAGVGKSTLVLEMAVKLSKGWEIWSLPVPESRKVMVVQAELPPQAMKGRLEGVLEGLNLSGKPDNLDFVNAGLDLDMDIAWLREAVEQRGIELLVIDPLSSYHSGDENDNSQMRPFLDRLKKKLPDISWIVVHHHGKPGDKGSTFYRGASSIKDWCDTMVNLRDVKGKLALEFEKVRHGPKLPNIILDRDGFTHRPYVEGAWAARMALKDMGGESPSQGQLVQAIRKLAGCSEKTAENWIKEAVKNGLIEESASPVHKQKKIYTL